MTAAAVGVGTAPSWPWITDSWLTMSWPTKIDVILAVWELAIYIAYLDGWPIQLTQ